MFKIFPDLEGYENLATTAKTMPVNLKDLNLDTADNTQEILIELSDSDPLYGVYKIIIYGKSTTADVSGWTAFVKVTGDVNVDVAANKENGKVKTTEHQCGDASTGTDTFTFHCDNDTAAKQIILRRDSSIEIAEVVIAGRKWTYYPCFKGYYSTEEGNHTQDETTGCKECADGTHAKDTKTVTCTACPTPVFYTNTLEHKQNDICQLCDEHKKAIDSGSNCGNCPMGQYLKATEVTCTDGTCDATCRLIKYNNKCYKEVACTDCVKGEYRGAGDPNNACIACPDGTVANTTGQDQCTDCQAGYHRDAPDKECKKCAAGTYQDEIKKNECKNCAAGWVAETEGLNSCVKCLAGTYAKDVTKACEPCEAGKYSSADEATECASCPVGEVPKMDANNRPTSCEKCPEGQQPNNDNTACVKCEAGKYKSDSDTECQVCAVGSYTDEEGQSSCKLCQVGEYQGATGKTACVKCEAGTYQNETGKDVCKPCAAGHYSDQEGQSTCTPCPKGEVQDLVKQSSCNACQKGEYQDAEGGSTCKECAAGSYSQNTGAEICTLCAAGYYQPTKKQDKCLPCQAGTYQDLEGKEVCKDCASGYISAASATECEICEKGHKTKEASQATECVKCSPGTYQPNSGSTECLNCVEPMVSLQEGQESCSFCELGQVFKTTSECVECQAGEYNDDKELATGVCKKCEANYKSEGNKQEKCDLCDLHEYSPEKSSTCFKCDGTLPADIDENMKDKTEVQRQKCKADLGDGCIGMDIETKYGTFNVAFMLMRDNETPQKIKCPHDTDKYGYFTCHKKDGKEGTEFQSKLECINSPKSKEYESIADDDGDADTKAESLKKLSDDDNQEATVGDIKGASDVIKAITKTGDEVSKKASQDVIASVSNMVGKDLQTGSVEEATKICNEMVDQVVEMTSKSEAKNEVIASPRVAAINIKKKSGDESDSNPSKGGVISVDFGDGGDLSGTTVGGDDEDTAKPPSLMIGVSDSKAEDSSQFNVVVVIFTDPSLMPDPNLIPPPILPGSSDNLEEQAAATWEFIKSYNGTIPTFINSPIVEVNVPEVGDDEDFQLELMIKPRIKMGNTSTSIKQVDEKRLQLRYECFKYNREMGKWERSCETYYDPKNIDLGVLCVCPHNTSFAVLMSPYEIDPEATKNQSIVTKILLGASTVCLLLTLIILLPFPALRSTRSAKTNICFSIALFLASTVFFIQDFLIKNDDTGIIKLQSIPCIVYAAVQHYLWLVCFMWMVIEGWGMYLSLVQVFGSHVSKFMLKFNIVAWGVPIIFPVIGGLVFTKTKKIGQFTITDHNYVAETMCFLKPESVAFYTLFLTPLLVCIVINLIVFGFVLRVIKSSTANVETVSKEQMMKQLKACVGIMVLLGTGWVFGVFMSVPAKELQQAMQWIFIILNSTQGLWVFLFYVVLNPQVKTTWGEQLGITEEASKKSTTSVSTFGNTNTKKLDNIYSNDGAEDHTYATTTEFPARSEDNMKI